MSQIEKPSVVNIFKDVDEIYGRLFNHRGVISGEIKYFLKEFEEQRKDREVERLFQILENTTDIRESQIEKIKNLSDSLLTSITDDFEAATSLCNSIIENTQDSENERIKEYRDEREKEWKNFQQEIAKEHDDIVDSFRAKKDELQKFFQNAEVSFKH